MRRRRAHSLVPLLLSIALFPACGMSHVWLETEGSLRVPIEKLRSIYASVQNGNIKSVGSRVKLDEVTVRYTVRAGGRDEDDAKECMRNVELLHNVDDAGLLRLHWRFATTKAKTWAARVDFLIDQPSTMKVRARSHNGSVHLEGIVADCNAQTHNGGIRIQGTVGRVDAVSHNGNVTIKGAKEIEARSHNGRLRIQSEASRIVLATHNGGITAEMQATPLSGTIVTHNGPISLRVAGRGPVEIEASGDDANITVGEGFEDVHNERQRAWAKRGIGSEKLRITTKSGIVDIQGK